MTDDEKTETVTITLTRGEAQFLRICVAEANPKTVRDRMGITAHDLVQLFDSLSERLLIPPDRPAAGKPAPIEEV